MRNRASTYHPDYHKNYKYKRIYFFSFQIHLSGTFWSIIICLVEDSVWNLEGTAKDIQEKEDIHDAANGPTLEEMLVDLSEIKDLLWNQKTLTM